MQCSSRCASAVLQGLACRPFTVCKLQVPPLPQSYSRSICAWGMGRGRARPFPPPAGWRGIDRGVKHARGAVQIDVDDNSDTAMANDVRMACLLAPAPLLLARARALAPPLPPRHRLRQ